MNGNTFGTLFCVTTFGESHGRAVGAVVDGAPAGLELFEAIIQEDLNRRRPGRSSLISPRRELDEVEILSGVFERRTTGHPIGLLIRNTDQRSEDYEPIKDLYRPGHADFTMEAKYGIRDWRGSGRASGRETVARGAAGAVARQMLNRLGVTVIGAVRRIGGVEADFTSEDWLTDWREAGDLPLRCPDSGAAQDMEQAILAAIEDGDSLGGVVEIRALGVPPGLGEPVFDKLEARLGAALLSIGAVKGVEFGDGFALADAKGSQVNDAPLAPGRHASNHAGGIVGGISNGENLIMRLAVKPPSSITKTQQTIDRLGEPREIAVDGRHDPCIAPRVVSVAEAMVCLVLADMALMQRARAGFAGGAA